MPTAEAVWTDGHRGLEIAVVGATGAVGRELLSILAAAGHPKTRIASFARAAQEIRVDPWGTFAVRAAGANPDPIDRPDLAFLCTPSDVALALAPALCARGVRVVDLSSAHRMHPEVPLVIPEINADRLGKDTFLVANPNCTTVVAALPLAALDRAAGLEEVVVASYQAASGAGLAGLATLAAEMRGAAAPARSPFPAPLALNVIPGVAEPEEDGWTGEERKIEQELKKILDRTDLLVEATTVRVPVERCHSVAVHARFAHDLSPAAARNVLARAEGILLVDDPHGPRPRECAGTDPVHVGRVRAGARSGRSLCFFAVGDQLRKGAALNAFQVAARLAGRA